MLVAWCSSEAAIESHRECTLSQVSTNPTPHWACPTTVKHSFIPHRTKSISGATNVAVMRPVPKCASSNYTMVDTQQRV